MTFKVSIFEKSLLLGYKHLYGYYVCMVAL